MTNWGGIGDARVEYPDQHIEADDRLAWWLGRLQKKYGDDVFYIHLVRDIEQTARSRMRKYHILYVRTIDVYRRLCVFPPIVTDKQVAIDYCRTINENIEAFLRDKNHKMTFRLESASVDWRIFWNMIGAEGDYDAALEEWSIRHNSSETLQKKANVKMAVFCAVVTGLLPPFITHLMRKLRYKRRQAD